jgi:hypothetical protein
MVTQTGTLQQVSALKWYHQIDLGNGVVTLESTIAHTSCWQPAESFKGKTVLISARGMDFSFEPNGVGPRVLATDSFPGAAADGEQGRI